jgi:hypothetical protein
LRNGASAPAFGGAPVRRTDELWLRGLHDDARRPSAVRQSCAHDGFPCETRAAAPTLLAQREPIQDVVVVIITGA